MGKPADSILEVPPGSRIRVNGRDAVFLYERRNGAVIRYRGEDQSRVIPRAKIDRATAR